MGQRITRRVVLIPLLAAACIAVAWASSALLFNEPGLSTKCVDRLGYLREYVPDTEPLPEYAACVEQRAQLFMKVDYENSKDLAKSFLTLLSALLVGSITFSEKIVAVHSASRTARSLMFGCWASFLGAILSCGVGLALMSMALGWSAYQPYRDYRSFELLGVRMFMLAGLSFGAGLVCLLMAGVMSLSERQDTSATT